MDITLTLSSQGQVVIPIKVRKILDVKPGEKLILTLDESGVLPIANIHTKPKSWVKLVSGLGKGVWGKGEEYVRKERDQWEE